MNFNPVSIGAAPLVATALGRSLNIKVVISPTATTAYTDGSTIFLPLLPVNLDEQLSTILWGLIHHEAGHCRHTDFDVLKEPELRSDRLLNSLFRALEDIRMERAHIRLYPGAARILADLVRVLVEIGFFKPLPADVDVSTVFHAFVLQYLRTTALGQQALADQTAGSRAFLEKELGPGFVTRLVAELQRILNAEATVDALNVAYRVRRFLEEELEAQQDPPPPSGAPGDSNDDSTDDSSGSPQSQPSNSSDDSIDSDPSDPSGDDSGGPDSSAPNDEDDTPTKGDDDDESDASKALKKLLAGSDIDSSLGDLGEALSDVLKDGISEQNSRPISTLR